MKTLKQKYSITGQFDLQKLPSQNYSLPKSSHMIKKLFFACLFLLSAETIFSQQTMCFINPSIEGTSAPNVVPAPWIACYGSPDTQPGQWGITQPASNGNTYVSFLQSGWSSNGYTEGMSQQLVPAMTAGTTYTFSVDLAHTNIYNTASPNGCYSSLAVWGGNSSCAQTQLLWTSGSFMTTAWTTYTITFTPTGNWSYISFCPYYITTCGSTGFDYINVMMDNLTCVVPQTSVTGTSMLCANICDGTATANVTTGTPPYTYVWTPGNLTSQTITGLCVGTYSCTVTDANGLTTTGNYSVTSPTALSATGTTTAILCNGGTGTGTATVTGGTGPYTYSWAPSGGSSSTASGLNGGTYTCYVTDANGCTTTQVVTLTNPAALTATSTFVNTSCGFNNGTASVVATGGTGTSTYYWTPSGGTGTTATGLAAGTYTCTVTDANGCTTTQTVTVAASLGVTATLASQVNLLCSNSTNGTATVNATGGTSPYNYAWSPSGGTAVTATGLPSGTFTCLITDAAGCTATQTVTITAPTPITATSTFTPASCGSQDGTATATASGGTGTITYAWTPSGQTTATATGLAVGNYTCTATDANGCTQTTTVIVVYANGPTAQVSPDIMITGGNSTNLTATGGNNGPYTYSWSPTWGLSCGTCPNPTATPTSTTQYCCTVTDAGGCTDVACMTVTVDVPCPTNSDFSMPNAFSPNGDGHNDQFLVLGWKPCLTDFVIRIYDRWGEKVYESKDITVGWDGTYKGQALDPAVFMYYISAKFMNGKEVIRKGNVSLIR